MVVLEHSYQLVHDTPLLKLSYLSDNPKVSIYAKLELQNPTGGIKDRIGIYMVQQLIAQHRIDAQSTVIEATAGNTGLGIALGLVGTGAKAIFVIPDKFSMEKQILLRAMGTTVINTPADQGMEGALLKAEELRGCIPGSLSIGQFENLLNPEAHYKTIGPEIYRDLHGNIDYFLMGAGSGGTFSGIARYLKEQKQEIQAVLVDPVGSTIGGGDAGDYHIEGIGNHFIPKTMDVSLIDQVFKVSDQQAFAAVHQLARQTGLFAGSSSGANLYAAQQLAKTLTQGSIVTVLNDRGERYFSEHLYD